MEADLNVVSAWSLIKAFNLFVKYLMMLHENRAYKKIRTYIDVTIQKGNQYAIQQLKAEEKRKQSER